MATAQPPQAEQKRRTFLTRRQWGAARARIRKMRSAAKDALWEKRIARLALWRPTVWNLMVVFLCCVALILAADVTHSHILSSLVVVLIVVLFVLNRLHHRRSAF